MRDKTLACESAATGRRGRRRRCSLNSFHEAMGAVFEQQFRGQPWRLVLFTEGYFFARQRARRLDKGSATGTGAPVSGCCHSLSERERRWAAWPPGGSGAGRM
jgi:hypothetical protein